MSDNDNHNRKNGLSRLIQLSGTKKNYLTIAGIFCALGSIAKMMIFFFIYLVLLQLVDSRGIIANINTVAIQRIAVGAGITLLLSLVLKSAGSVCSHIAAFNILYELRVQLSKKLAKLPMGYFTAHTSGSIKKIMSEDVERIEHFVAHHIVDFISGVVTPLVTLIFMFAVDWRMAVAALISIPFAIIVGSNLFTSKTNKVLSDKYQKAVGKMNGSAVEYIKGMPVIKTFSEGKTVFTSLKKDIEGSRQAAMTWANGLKNPYILFSTLMPASILFIFPLGVYLISNPLTYETMLTTVLFFFIIGTNFAEPMKQLMLLTAVMRKVTYGMECIDAILDEEEIPEANTSISPKQTSVAFNHVSFCYDDVQVLNNISFRCEQGTVTALVGPSGAGKSTIAKLIARFWDVGEGHILISGQDIKAYSNVSLMDQVSFVFQDVCMLSDTIEENIRMGNHKASFDDVVSAAKAAQIHDFIELLPNGYQTKIGETGVHLSGGEQQRISIARIFLKNTPIIVLDEATAYADAENEALIQKAFSQLAKNKTVIVVAHRLSTIAGADNIIVVDEGELTESGTHEELMNMQGIYYNLWQAMCESDRWKLSTKEVAS